MGVYEKLRSGLYLASPVLDFARKKFAPLPSLSAEELDRLIAALPSSPGDNGVGELDADSPPKATGSPCGP